MFERQSHQCRDECVELEEQLHRRAASTDKRWGGREEKERLVSGARR